MYRSFAKQILFQPRSSASLTPEFWPEGRRQPTSLSLCQIGCPDDDPSESRRAAQLPERPSSACSSSTLRGDLRTSAPGAYLPAVSASGTCAYRRAARAARRPDLMDKPSLQTALTNKLVRARPATPAPLSGQAMHRLGPRLIQS